MRISHRLVMAPLTAGAILLLGSSVYAAGTGYSPTTSPVPSGTPGGYTKVVTVKTISPNSTTNTTISVSVDNIPVNVVVPPGTFSGTVQVAVTVPVLSQVTGSLGALGYSGYHAIAGLGVNVVNSSNQPYVGSFLKPMSVDVRNSAISTASHVVEWNSNGHFSTIHPTSLTNGSATWTFQQDPAFAIINPPKSSIVPGATSPVTGKPFVLEGAIGLFLAFGGSTLLWKTRRQKLP